MKQIVQFPNGETRLTEVAAPGVAPGTLLVQTDASLVSVGTERMIVDFAQKGLLAKARARPDLVRQVVRKVKSDGLLTTMDAVTRRLDQPMPLGYSAAGRVVAVGEGVTGVREGDLVACAGAGHAEVLRVPLNLTATAPEGVAAEEAAFATVGAIALHGFRIAEVQLGERIVVIGLGLVGLLAVQIAAAAGVRVFGIDPDVSRQQLASNLGADRVSGSDAGSAAEGVQAWTGGVGADAVLVCASTRSSEPVELAAEVARDRAKVVLVGAVGMEVPRRPFFHKELDLRVSRSYGPGRYDPVYEQEGVDYPIGYVRWTQGRNLASFLELIATGCVLIDPLITHRIPIEDAEQAYTLITEGTEASLGVVLTYSGGSEALRRSVDLSPRPRPVKSKEGGKTGLGLVGAGMFASGVLLPAVQNSGAFALVGVCTSNGLSGRHAADKFGFGYSTTDLDRLLTDENVELIAIATRHGSHARQTIQALGAGKHVFVEKPLCLTRAELADVLGAWDRAGRTSRVMVGFNRRFAPLAAPLREFVESAAEPALIHYRVNAGALPLDHWVHDPADGGGRIIGEVCHFVDFVSYLTDALPVRVVAGGVADGTRYREDNVHLTVTLSDGSCALITYAASGDRSTGKERCEVFAGGGTAVLDDFRSLDVVRGGKSKRHKAGMKQDKGHGGEWVALAAALQTNEPGPLSMESIVATTLTTFAAVESLRTGTPVVIDVAALLDGSEGAE